MIPRYHETKQPRCKLALDCNLTDPSIINLLTKKGTKKRLYTLTGKALKTLNIFRLAKPLSRCQAPKFCGLTIMHQFQSLSINPYLILSPMRIGLEKPTVKATGINHP